MTISPSPTYKTSPRAELITDIMLMIDHAIESGEDVSSWTLAEQIVERVVPTPLDPQPATSGSTNGLNPTLAAMVKASRAKFAL